MNKYRQDQEMSVTVPTLCNELEQLAIETWDRIGFARSRSGLKIYETTITQNLLFSLKKFSEHHKTSRVQMFEATNEKTNGNDLEIFLQVENGYICLPTQAKIIYKGEKYTKMEHGDQIKDLMNYAKSIDGYPLYLLYNYVTKTSLSKNNGCSIVSAQYLYDTYAYKTKKKRWIIPTFSDLHPNIAEPWEILACDTIAQADELFLTSLKKELVPRDYRNIKEYSMDEVLYHPSWKRLSFAPQYKSSEENKEEDAVGFSPKFRIVFSMDKQEVN